MGRSVGVLVAALALGVTSAGCASTGPPAGEAIGAAEYALRKAKEDGAGEFAAVEVRQAEDKLARAKAERTVGADRTAVRLAHEVALEAQVAEAKAANERIRRARAEIEKSLEGLRSEIERQQRGEP